MLRLLERHIKPSNFYDFVYFRGLLDYKERICKYWPEFAKNGKENVTLEMYITNRVNKEKIWKCLCCNFPMNFQSCVFSYSLKYKKNYHDNVLFTS